MNEKRRPEIGAKMYFTQERLYYDRAIQTAPFLEYCVCEGTVYKYIGQNDTEMCLLCDGALSYFKLSSIGKTVFHSAKEAALAAKARTERHERTWGCTGEPSLRRTWSRLRETGERSTGR